MHRNVWMSLFVVAACTTCAIASDDEARRHARAAEQSVRQLNLADAERQWKSALRAAVSNRVKADVLNNLGFLYWRSGAYSQAEHCYRQSINVSKHGPEVDDLLLIRTLNNLAALYANTHRFAKLERLDLESFVPRLTAQESAKRDLARLYVNLGLLKQGRSDYGPAEKYLLQALQVFESTEAGGTDSVEVSNNLAVLFERAGRNADAVRWLERTRELADVALPPGDWRKAVLLANIGAMNLRLRRFENADYYYRTALNAAEASLGPEHPIVAEILSNYAVVLRAQKRGDLAKTIEKRSHAILSNPAVSASGRHTVELSELTPP